MIPVREMPSLNHFNHVLTLVADYHRLEQILASGVARSLYSTRGEPNGTRTVCFSWVCLFVHMLVDAMFSNEAYPLRWNVVVRDEELTAWVKEVVEVYELEKGVRSPAKCSAVAPRPTLEDRKRRRDQSRDSSSPSSSCSRGSSPEARHHRASHAAAALLGLPKPKRRTSARIQDRRISPYSSRPSSTFSSSSSSCFASPMLGSGATTPGSPSTPNSDGGPITPDHVDQCLAPAWAQTCFLPIKERQYSTRINGSIVEVTSW